MGKHTQSRGSPERKDTWEWRHTGKGNAGVSHSVLKQNSFTHTHTDTHARTHTHAHSAVKISANPVYYLLPLRTLPLFFILSIPLFVPHFPLLSFSLSLLLKLVLAGCALTHTHTHVCAHTLCQFTPVMFAGLGLRRGNGKASVDVHCSFPAPALVHVLQRELPSLCLCDGAAAFTICAEDTVAGRRAPVWACRFLAVFL